MWIGLRKYSTTMVLLCMYVESESLRNSGVHTNLTSNDSGYNLLLILYWGSVIDKDHIGNFHYNIPSSLSISIFCQGLQFSHKENNNRHLHSNIRVLLEFNTHDQCLIQYTTQSTNPSASPPALDPVQTVYVQKVPNQTQSQARQGEKDGRANTNNNMARKGNRERVLAAMQSVCSGWVTTTWRAAQTAPPEPVRTACPRAGGRPWR